MSAGDKGALLVRLDASLSSCLACCGAHPLLAVQCHLHGPPFPATWPNSVTLPGLAGPAGGGARLQQPVAQGARGQARGRLGHAPQGGLQVGAPPCLPCPALGPCPALAPCPALPAPHCPPCSVLVWDCRCTLSARPFTRGSFALCMLKISKMVGSGIEGAEAAFRASRPRRRTEESVQLAERMQREKDDLQARSQGRTAHR